MVTAPRLAGGLLLAFVVFTAGYGIGKEVGMRRALERSPAPAPPTAGGEDPTGVARSTPSATPDTTERRIVAWYFHSTKRCAKCNTIEAYAKEALDTLFPEERASGAIEWRVENMDDLWNADAVRRYGLVQSSLVLVDMLGDQEHGHAVLNHVWDLTDDKKAFFAYVQDEVEMLRDEEEPEASGE